MTSSIAGKRLMNAREDKTESASHTRGLRRRLGLKRSQPTGTRSGSTSSDDEQDEMAMLENNTTDNTQELRSPVKSEAMLLLESPTAVTSPLPTLSPTESKRRTSASSDGSSSSASSSTTSMGADKSTLSLSRKGVKYGRDGSVVCCRFCEILRSGDADFVYEDDAIAVFRPLAPVVESHVLVVPRCHIRNINMLTTEHADLLKRMREVAELVLLRDGGAKSGQSIECKFAFHKPPFNSIDHVHMHAFRKSGSTFGCLGSIKYRTETWWCRSFQEVFSRVDAPTPTHSETLSHSAFGGMQSFVSTRS